MIKVISIEPKENKMIFVKLSNGKEGYFDVSPYLDKGIFKELKNDSYFKQARISFGGIAWPKSQDFSADTVEMELRVL
jgi:hypothetical protein